MKLSFILYVLAAVTFFLALVGATDLPWTGIGFLLLAAGLASQDVNLR